MANSIDILKDTKTNTNNNSAKTTESKVAKDKPSLFDSLLTSNKQESKTTATKADPAKSSDAKLNEELKQEPNVKISEEKKNSQSSSNDIKEDKVKNTSSLLDRMIVEAKKDIKTIGEESKKLNNKNSEIIKNPKLEDEVKTELKTEVKLNEEVENSTTNTKNNKNTENIENIEKLEEETKKLNNKNSEIIKNPKLEDEVKTELKTEVKLNEEVENIDKLEEETKNLNNKSNLEILKEQEKNTTKNIENLDENPKLKDSKTELKTEVKLDEEVENSTTNTKNIKNTESIENIDKLEEEPKNLNNKSNLEILKEQEKNTTKNTENLDENPKLKDSKTELKTEVKLEDKLENNILNIKNTKDGEGQLQDLESDLTSNNEKNIVKTQQNESSTNEKLNILNTNVSSNSDTKASLMDQLILKNSMNNQNTTIQADKNTLSQDQYIPKEIVSNIYLSTQKNSINSQGLFNKNEAINLLKDAKSVSDVKTSAEMLDLGLEDLDLTLEENQSLNVKTELNKKIDMDLLVRKNLLNNMIFEKKIKDEDVKSLITKSVEASNALIEDTLELADDAIVSVNSPLSYNIQSKIIGARQQMSTMMSDIARQMYENYKPPVTVFRINLNPLELGSIAILMKSDKNSALSISMSVSNSGTLDALIENQNVLRNSLSKTFDENSRFNLDFSSSSERNDQSNSQNDSSNSNNSSNSSSLEEQMDTQSVLKLKEENKDEEEKSIDYM